MPLIITATLTGLLFQYSNYQHEIVTISQEKTETEVSTLQKSVSYLQKVLQETKTENESLKTLVQGESEKNNSLANQFQSVANTVGTLDKLSKTDPQLLAKYSKVYFLNENYIPVQLADIDPVYVQNPNPNTPMQIHASVWPHLSVLLQTAVRDGIDIKVISSYRSFGTQAALKSTYKVTYGTTAANKFSADQGYSEHQLGTAIDFTTSAGSLTKFETTPAYTWLLAHAYEYGFVISYPSENKYYQFEPWHWRFVGRALATKIHNEGTYFYAVDQRTINQYLASIFD